MYPCLDDGRLEPQPALDDRIARRAALQRSTLSVSVRIDDGSHVIEDLELDRPPAARRAATAAADGDATTYNRRGPQDRNAAVEQGRRITSTTAGSLYRVAVGGVRGQWPPVRSS